MANGDYVILKHNGTDFDEKTVLAVASKVLGFDSSLNPTMISLPAVSKAVTIESPTGAEDITLFYTVSAITISKLISVVSGTSPSATFTIRHGADRTTTGNEVITGGSTCTSTTVGLVQNTFNDATIPAGSFVWIETTATSGTISELNVTIEYSED